MLTQQQQPIIVRLITPRPSVPIEVIDALHDPEMSTEIITWIQEKKKGREEQSK